VIDVPPLRPAEGRWHIDCIRAKGRLRASRRRLSRLDRTARLEPAAWRTGA